MLNKIESWQNSLRFTKWASVNIRNQIRSMFILFSTNLNPRISAFGLAFCSGTRTTNPLYLPIPFSPSCPLPHFCHLSTVYSPARSRLSAHTFFLLTIPLPFRHPLSCWCLFGQVDLKPWGSTGLHKFYNSIGLAYKRRPLSCRCGCLGCTCYWVRWEYT